MSQSNNGLQIFWLVKSYSLIVITVQCFFSTQNMQPALGGKKRCTVITIDE